MNTKIVSMLITVILLWALFTAAYIAIGGIISDAIVFSAYKIPTFVISIGMYELISKRLLRHKE